MSELKIFLCAHKPIENYIPRDKRYVIIAQTKDVTNDYNHNFNDVIDISDDEFTKDHWICYGEGCAMKYLYNHPEILPDYVGFGHYRRMLVNFVGKEDLIPKYVGNTAIVKRPCNHTRNCRRRYNLGAMYFDHLKEEVDAFIESVKEAAPEYWNSFQKLLNDYYQYNCNIFIMKKENFLEMCEMCFRVLGHFDKKQGYKNNDDVYERMLKDKDRLQHDISWQRRLQGFWLEWLTELYYRHKFGVMNCVKVKAGIPNE